MTKPNLVFITFDSLRADHCGYVGYDRNTTPNIDDLANNGISFTNAVSPASRTNPSMAGIFTGEPLVTRGKVSNPNQSKYHLERYGTIASRLSEQGYSTGAFCPNAYASRYYGFDKGFDDFEDFLFDSGTYQKVFQKHLNDSKISTSLRNIRNLIRKEEAFRTWDTYVDDMVEWANKQDSPYFMWGFSLDTHFPYITPRQHRKWSNSFSTYYYNWRCNKLLDQFDIEISERDQEGIRNIYDDSIRFADKLVGELRDRLDMENTILIISADHGEAIGERGMYGHFYPSLFEENIHVPFAIGGDIDRSETIEKPVPLTDLPKVLVEIAETGSTTYSGAELALSSAYDGVRDRNLLSIKMNGWKGHLVKQGQEGDWVSTLYELNEKGIESQEPVKDSPLMEIIDKKLQKRAAHEEEILDIRDVCAQRSGEL